MLFFEQTRIFRMNIMNNATLLTTKNNAWLTVGKATWVAFWFLLALAVKASIILIAIAFKLFAVILGGILNSERIDDDPFLQEQSERQAAGADDFEAYK